MALITCAPIPFIFVSGIVFSKKVRPFFRSAQKKMGELNGKLQDNLSGIHEIQSFGREEYETERVNERNFEHQGRTRDGESQLELALVLLDGLEQELVHRQIALLGDTLEDRPVGEIVVVVGVFTDIEKSVKAEAGGLMDLEIQAD